MKQEVKPTSTDGSHGKASIIERSAPIVAALGLTLSLGSFSPALRAQALDPRDDGSSDTLSTLLTTTKPAASQEGAKVLTQAELEEVISRVVAREVARSQTNDVARARDEQMLRTVLEKFVQGGGQRVEAAQAATNSGQLSSPLSQGYHEVEATIHKKTGWTPSAIASTLSSLVVGGTAAWLVSMPLLRRYPNEFDIKLADLRANRDPNEEFGVEPLFGRTEVDVLVGKPKAMSSTLLHFFIPEKWALMRAQVLSKMFPGISFLRFSDNSVFRALGTFLKVNEKPALKNALRQAHYRLVREVEGVEGEGSASNLDPIEDGEEVVSVMTYERWRTKINRVLAMPSKDVCVLLLNPKRYFDQILSHYKELSSPESAEKFYREMTGFMRRLEIALGLMEQRPEIIQRYIGQFPNSWALAQRNAAALKPILVFNETQGICYLTKYMQETPAVEDGAQQQETLRNQIMKRYACSAPGIAQREIGVLSPREERLLKNSFHPRIRLLDRMKQGAAYAVAAAKWTARLGTWAEVQPAPMGNNPYHWFGEVKLPDPRSGLT